MLNNKTLELLNNNIIANFGENGKITVELSENGFIKNVLGKM